jgi:hypothetical protein
MESIIRVIKGPDEGGTATLLPGQTVIGRGAKSGLKLTTPAVSYEHAVISRIGEDYFVENLSAHGTWVNDVKVAGRVRLRPRDQLKLADDTVLRFEPEGMPEGLLARRNLLIVAVVVLAVSGMIVAYVNPFAAASEGLVDWNRTYKTIDQWVAREVAQNRIPQKAQILLETGWRLHIAGNDRDAAAQWLNLKLLLDTLESAEHFSDYDGQYRTALHELCFAKPDSPQAYPSEEQTAAATIQFVRYWLDRSVQTGK